MAPDSDGDGYGDSDGFNNLYFNRQRVNRNGDGNGNYVWKKVEKETATHPRIGVSFPVSDRTVFRATMVHTGNQYLCLIYIFQIHSYQLTS